MDPNVLRECAQRLLETADFIRNTNRAQPLTMTTSSATASGFTAATSQAPSTTPMSTIMHPRLNSAPSQTDNNARDETVRSEHNRLFAVGRQLLHEEGECCVVDQVDGHTQTPALPTLLEGAQIAHGPGHLFAWQLLASKPRHQRHYSVGDSVGYLPQLW